VTAISLTGLSRTYGDRVAVHPVDLDIPAGECFGILGPNGAGKSTTLKMLTTMSPPSAGQGTVAGADLRDVAAVRARIGVVFQSPSLDLRLSALENMDFYAALHRPIWSRGDREARALAALAQMGLADRAREEVGRFSWGMRRRVEIARALLTEPGVLFLDEPTTGLDPQTRAALWEHLAALRRTRSLTIVVATHDMEEAARCDRVGVLVDGRFVAVASPAQLVTSTGRSDLLGAFLALTGAHAARETGSVDEAFRARASGSHARD
jgi:ABC-2 type transport system ATP-binding protein